jgi:hypothetical protein
MSSSSATPSTRRKPQAQPEANVEVIDVAQLLARSIKLREQDGDLRGDSRTRSE